MIIFLTVGLIAGNIATDFLFLAGYPFVLLGMIPVTLISYDEKEKWNIYSLGLPYSKKEIVSSKYLTGLLTTIPAIILYCIVYSIKMAVRGEFSFQTITALVMVMLFSGILLPSFVLPFIFGLGAEKGRIIYLLKVGMICGALVFLTDSDSGLNDIVKDLCSATSGAIAFLLSAGLYALSWFLSIKFYEKRKL